MKKRVILALLVVIAVVLFVLKNSFNSGPMSYLKFVNQEQAYYTNLAVACNRLWTASQIQNIEKRKIPADSLELPKVIQDLHPSEVVVYSNIRIQTNVINHVSIRIGISRNGYGISWKQFDTGNGERTWELSAGNEGAGKELLLIRNSEIGVLGDYPK